MNITLQQNLGNYLECPSSSNLSYFSFPQKDGITHVDIDLTLDCNLKCTYCFKSEKEKIHIKERIAYDAFVWLLYTASMKSRISMALMGGEPLTNYALIKNWIPFVKRRAKQHGTDIHISMTTNCTLVNDDVIDFWKEWGLSFHTSIDGIPEIQNTNRPTVNGGNSSHLVENGVTKILKVYPQTTARCTVVPETVNKISDSYTYFRNLGYTNIAMIPSNFDVWNKKSILSFEEQFFAIADLWLKDVRKNNTWVCLKNIDDYLQGMKINKRPVNPCGAGVAMVAIDIYGNIWPCSRMTKHNKEKWCLGSIYGEFNNELRERFLQGCPLDKISSECNTCEACGICRGGCQAENLDCINDIYGIHPNRCDLMNAWVRVGKYVHESLYQEKNLLFMKKYYIHELQEQQVVKTSI
jgi:uncharacterized protein